MCTEDQSDRLEDQASSPDPFQKRDDGFFNPKLNQSRLPQDYDSPASPPSDIKEKLPKDFPETDTSLEESEVYDEGVSSATDADAQEDTGPPQHGVRPLEPKDDEDAQA